MERDTLETTANVLGGVLGALAVVLLLPATRRRVLDLAQEKLGDIDAAGVAAHAGAAAAKAALSEAGVQAAMKIKDQLLG